MIIRKSTLADIPRMMEIYEYARGFMVKTGNPNQWAPAKYPQAGLLEQDIANGNSYIIEDNGHICGTLAFIIGNDPTYEHIDGGWKNDEPYGTIHRIAGDGSRKGLLMKCVDHFGEQIGNIRIDTHHDNKVMQHLVKKAGFDECGTIYLANGDPRIAYHKIIQK